MIETNRLIFRSYQDSDLPFLFSLLSNPHVTRYIGNGETRDKEGAFHFLQRIYSWYESGEAFGLKLLLDRTTGKPVGHAGLVPQTVETRKEIEIGYWIDEEYWGRGYASEAAGALKAYGREELKLERLIALIQNRNKASRRVAEKIGMKIEKEIHLKGRKVLIYVI